MGGWEVSQAGAVGGEQATLQAEHPLTPATIPPRGCHSRLRARPPLLTLQRRSRALDSVMTPPMAAGISTSQETSRIRSLDISTPPGKAARLQDGEGGARQGQRRAEEQVSSRWWGIQRMQHCAVPVPAQPPTCRCLPGA